MNWLECMPKVEIHLHLEGAVEPEDLKELARRNHLSDADWPIQAFEEKYHYKDFMGFLMAFKFITEHLVRAEDYGWITSRLISRLHAMGVIYAEIFFSAGVALWQKKNVDAIAAEITAASREQERRRGVGVNWIFDVTRQFGPEPAARVVDAAVRCRKAGMHNVVAVGMGGDENFIGAREFVPVFAKAHDHGLHVTIHAGEVAGPQSIWEALGFLGAERIGHGVAARWDERLMDHLKEKQITLECAPTSNLRTGAIARIEEHPLAMFLRRGLRATLNTDDPPLFHTDLLREYRLAAERFHFSREDFARLNENAIDGSFAEPAQKAEVRKKFDQQWAALATSGEHTRPCQN
jgi:aminodeoxyfutalosine deaminase